MGCSGGWRNWQRREDKLVGHTAEITRWRDYRVGGESTPATWEVALFPSETHQIWTERCWILLLFIPWQRAKISRWISSFASKAFLCLYCGKGKHIFFPVAMYTGKYPIQRIVLQELWKHLPAENLGALFKQADLPTFQNCWLCRAKKCGLF